MDNHNSFFLSSAFLYFIYYTSPSLKVQVFLFLNSTFFVFYSAPCIQGATYSASGNGISLYSHKTTTKNMYWEPCFVCETCSGAVKNDCTLTSDTQCVGSRGHKPTNEKNKKSLFPKKA